MYIHIKKGDITNMNKISIFNNRGGVGKASGCVMIGHGLAKLGYKVLLVDMDDQNNCSLFLGMDTSKYDKTFMDLMNNPDDFDECIYQARENLDLLPNNNFRSIEKAINLEDSNRRNIRTILSEKLRQAEDYEYDYLIVDCSPSRNSVNDAVLFYVDRVFVPIQLEVASIQGVVSIYNHLSNIGVDQDKIDLIIPNLMDKRTKEHKENLELIKNKFDEMVTQPINRRTKITEASRRGLTVYEHDNVAEEQFYTVLRRVVNG